MDLAFPESEEIHAWEQFLRELPEEFMSRPQRLQFILMLTTRFNLFTPLPVVRDLLPNRHLWLGMVMDRGVLQPREGQYGCAKIRPGEVSDDLMGIGRSSHPVQIIGVWWD